ncbi:MAG: ATP-dependent DNA ligase [Candidatus Bathyarchaeota archaeon]|uniref:ATP-dependent DNA ligase n=1 Tax=Candidatus Bathycorpusculum sp. TaxID=2994959 RepID=UPI0028262905|nr:ATP-dependent DNA ligase [Candidatus Termiticorpusculum sp.]MCL2257406.1 ATP-dependent DNA ligase [Candidatus Termiticorpusculum sp.]MCL2292443.1 ATP-dependent DNA ligase [Candidatus Termiticorpusculum sp.]
MDYAIIADAYGKIEATTKRLEMTDILVDLLKNTSKDVVAKIIYLTQGKLYPDFMGIEIGIAEKLAIKALIRASGRKESEILADLQKTGDLGLATEIQLAKKKQSTFFSKVLTVEHVYESLDKMAKTTGSGAVDTKTAVLAGLLSDASPKEAKYLIRTVTGNLRLGIADMTALEALAIAYGGNKDARGSIERAYNICSDLGRVADILVREGLELVKNMHIMVFEPIRPMLAERLPSPEEILEKFNGKCLAEYKYDGERIQVHKQANIVNLYSRRLENISSQYPDVIELIKKQVNAREAIFEAECVAVDIETGDMRPFQELMHRRRKYGIENAIEKYPISLFAFDLLFVNGKDLTREPLTNRRAALEETLNKNVQLQIATQKTVNTVKELEDFFEQAIGEGCEGLMCKSITKDSVYQAGNRGWLWIKYKRDYKSEMTDTCDLVVVGAFHGRGKRAGAYGALLLASYNPEKDMFETTTKCGTGFTEKDIADLHKMLQSYVIVRRHTRVLSMMEADVWFEPVVVLEVLGAEVTLSPIHTCSMDAIRKSSGFAIRFPRFTGKYRTDKSPQDATNSKEIVAMYQSQLKQITVK